MLIYLIIGIIIYSAYCSIKLKTRRYIVDNQLEYQLGTKVIMKKQHPCGNNLWEIVRVGADIKIRCIACQRTVLIPRVEFNKKVKKIVIGDV